MRTSTALKPRLPSGIETSHIPGEMKQPEHFLCEDVLNGADAITNGGTKLSTGKSAGVDALTMFSFEDIVDEINVKRAAAKTGAASWDRLKAVASELAGVPSTSEIWPTAGAVWTLEQVSIRGYRGIGNDVPLVLNFDPTPGLTVLHGLNGAGKSSISDAIEIGLTGRTPTVTAGTAGKAALWDPIHLARGATSARVEVVLASDGHRLLLVAVLDSLGAIQSHEAELTNAVGTKKIALDASWHDALASHQPVFAYASLERRVQLSKDLATYFEGLLALGGSFTTLEDTITSRANESTQAHSRWRSAKEDAMKSLAAIDTERGSETNVIILDPVQEPSPGNDWEKWLKDEGLLQVGTTSFPLPSDSREQLTIAASRANASIRTFDKARVSSEQNLSTALELLHSEATSRHIDSTACPVCSAPNPKWLETLGTTVAQNKNLMRLQRDVESEIRALASVTETLLPAVLRVGKTAGADDPIRSISSTAKDLMDQFNEAHRTSHPTQHLMLSATTALCAWLVSEDARTLINEAVVRTDATKQWQISRARAVENFITVWKADGALAAEAVSWKETLKRVDDLRKQLRKRRSMTLEGKAGSRIENLLSDAELHLKGISVLSSKASMELVDQNDNKVELGMLSAGQRNAVLLAPLLASVDAGPFGFLILDDPVHAFDELRIDRLAESLSRIADSRRVIVLTHDDRLKEYLAARTTDFDTRLVDRSSASGTVEVSDSSHFWRELLTDAGHIHDLALRETGSTKDVTDALRRLCRMSIDNALRTFTLRNAVVACRDAAEDLKTLDTKNKTEERLHQAESFWQGSTWQNPVTRAFSDCAPHLTSWNRSVHGNPQTSDFSRDEIRDARKACQKLVTIP